MIASESASALKLARAAVGSALSALNGIQLAIILPALGVTAYSLVQFLFSLKDFVTQLLFDDNYISFANEFRSIFESDLFHLFSYCASLDTLGLVFNFFFFAFSTFVVLVGTSIALWAATKFWPTVSEYLYKLAKQVTGG